MFTTDPTDNQRRRTFVDFSALNDRVPAQLASTHQQLLDWARWCKTGRFGRATAPGFEGYRPPSAFDAPRTPTSSLPPQQLGLTIERTVAALPMRYRELLRGWYVLNTPPMRMCTEHSIRPIELEEELNNARGMVRNQLRAQGVRNA